MAITEKVELYYCDKRIVLSQMTDEELDNAGLAYLSRKLILPTKIKKFNKIFNKIV